jgi:hypothetical protein
MQPVAVKPPASNCPPELQGPEGTPEENAAVVQGSIAYFGRYSINEAEKKINLHYDGSTYPNWDGEDQVRLITIAGDELQIVSPVSAVGGGVVHLVLRRAK